MPKETIYLNAEKTDFVLTNWKGDWKNLTVNYKGIDIGTVPTKKELKTGQNFHLDNERTISVKLIGSVFPKMEMLLNGHYIKGSASDPRVQVKQIYFFALVLGLINLTIGIVALLFQIDLLLSFGIGTATIIAGILFVIVAMGIKQEALWAVYGLLILLGLEIITSFYYGVNSNINPTTGIMIKVLLMMLAFKGIRAVKTLDAEKALLKTETNN